MWAISVGYWNQKKETRNVRTIEIGGWSLKSYYKCDDGLKAKYKHNEETEDTKRKKMETEDEKS